MLTYVDTLRLSDISMGYLITKSSNFPVQLISYTYIYIDSIEFPGFAVKSHKSRSVCIVHQGVPLSHT